MTPNMRCILVDWLVEVAQEYRLTSDTLHLTVCLLDRFLSTEPIPREELQLAGIAAMWAAAKFEEIYAPTARSFCYITDNTYDAAQLVDMEARLLAALEFRLAMPTAKTFQRRYLQAAAADERLHYLSAFLLELSLMDECLLNLLPSQLAAASVYAAGAMLGRKPWDCTLTHYSRYRECDVLPVASRLAASHARLLGEAQFTAICDKYCSPKLLCVSATPPCQRLLAGAAADGSAAAAMAAQLQQHLMATATAPAGGAVCATAPVDCSGSGSGSGLDCSSSDMELL
jgi:cyclin-A